MVSQIVDSYPSRYKVSHILFIIVRLLLTTLTASHRNLFLNQTINLETSNDAAPINRESKTAEAQRHSNNGA